MVPHWQKPMRYTVINSDKVCNPKWNSTIDAMQACEFEPGIIISMQCSELTYVFLIEVTFSPFFDILLANSILKRTSSGRKSNRCGTN